MITWLGAGRNDPRKATAYCGGKFDAKGLAREEVTIIRGSPQIFELAASGLPFRETYKSGVLAWAPSDQPSSEDINAVVDDFLSLCFGGLNPDDFSSVVYLHRSETKVDVHVLVANVHVPTGKHFNCAPPGWQKDFDPLRDMWNWRKGWARPDDPRRARDYHPGKSVAISAARFRAGLHVEPDIKTLLAGYIEYCIDAGQISCHEHVVSALSDVGVINRVGENYISIVPNGHKKPVRLKGAHFSASFGQKMPTPSFKTPELEISNLESGINLANELEAQLKYKERIARRLEYNSRRYRKSKIRRPGSTVPTDLVQLDSTALKLKDLAAAATPKHSFISGQQPSSQLHISDFQQTTQRLMINDAAASLLSNVPQESYESDRSALEKILGRLISRVREGFQQLRKTTDRFGETMRRVAARSALDDGPTESAGASAKKSPRLRR